MIDQGLKAGTSEVKGLLPPCTKFKVNGNYMRSHLKTERKRKMKEGREGWKEGRKEKEDGGNVERGKKGWERKLC